MEALVFPCDEYLKIEKIYNNLHYAIFVITIQAFIDEAFLNGQQFFEASNRFRFTSISRPSCVLGSKLIFVRGTDARFNDAPCVCLMTDFAEICKAVEEYNNAKREELLNADKTRGD